MLHDILINYKGDTTDEFYEAVNDEYMDSFVQLVTLNQKTIAKSLER